LQTYSSVLTTWSNNKFYKLYRNRDDLYVAPKLLTKAYVQHKNISLAINYDQLVDNTDETLNTIFDYLNIDNLTAVDIDLTKITFAKNEMGDKTGQEKYSQISVNSMNSWHQTFNTPIRKWYIKRYIKHLGNDVAKVYNYSTTDIEKQIDQLPIKTYKTLFNDITGITCQWLVYKCKLNLVFSTKYHKAKKGFYD
jgi:hypothetical protein